MACKRMFSMSTALLNKLGHRSRIKKLAGFAVYGLWATVVAPADLAAAAECDRMRGLEAFERCAMCHSLQPGDQRMGPTLTNLRGRVAGSLQGFTFSSALRSSGIAWDEQTLDRFLSDPQNTVPGTTMPFRGVKEPTDRAALICYLLAP